MVKLSKFVLKKIDWFKKCGGSAKCFCGMNFFMKVGFKTEGQLVA
ncbi:hypothetical protein ADIS_2925 [Lunatimonas lonarensis]|uniref:Uncharacterized protein n=1 Tax=Lunatimonas lonarensis TaxID=1232681 RepID=R7ZQT1_9BACT|nr:hypothetical protein ADIS_2925 [Lunatimonas lonarensis]